MIVVDVETSGFDPRKHSIVSIGAIDWENPTNQFYEECRIWEGAEIWMGNEDYKSALEINGFTLEQIRDQNKKSLGRITEELFLWIDKCRDRTLGGINPSFDRDFIKDSAKRHNLKYNLGDRTVDLHTLVYTHHITRGISVPIKKGRTDIDSNKIFDYVGPPHEPFPHNALTGAKMEAEAFSRLIYGKSLFQEYSQNKIPGYLLQ